MTRRKFLAYSLGLGWAAALRAQRFSELRPDPAKTAGFAEADISPALGAERPGGYKKAFHRRMFDPCKVRAAVFADSADRLALVGVDALVVPRATALAARRRIARESGIPGDAVMIAASHSHSSGPTGMVQPGEYDHANELVRKLAYEQSSCADAEYLQLVEDQIVRAVLQADAAREPSLCGFGSGSEQAGAINRRVRMRNGLTYTHPRQGNPEIAGGPGPIDPEVGVIGAWNRHGRMSGCIVNYACHATSSPPGISANWIYWMERTLRGVFGPDLIVVFTAGASGNVTPVDNFGPYANPSGADSQRFVGGRVGAEAVKALLSTHPGDFAPLARNSKTLEVARRKPSAAHLRESLAIVQQDPATIDEAQWLFAKEVVMLDALLQVQPAVEVEVQALQIGPAIFVSNPAEYFVEYGLEIKKASPFALTFPVELANGFVGYVPTEAAFGAHGGGYETRLTSYSNLAIDAGRRIADASIALANSFEPGRLPPPPAHPRFAGPWSYGNVPPQVE